jgi:6-phosphogluconate dehydrogenase
MSDLNDIAVVGLGVMGANFARNFASRGYRVAGYDRSVSKAHDVARAHPEAKLAIAEDWAQLVAGLERPRRIVVLVVAGKPMDDVLDALDPLLEQDDIVVDAGNSLYSDTDRRNARAAGRPWRFVGMGISGGSDGALLGPSIMPGGDVEAWERLRPLLEAVAAKSESGTCVTYCGRGSAGHFVKMVHNGIEYGDMQLIAETATLLRDGLGLAPTAVADTFSQWNRGDLASFLVEITADIFRTDDPQRPGSLLVDAILDKAGQKGTGKWTVMAALEMGVAVPTIAAAVDARVLSAQKDLRVRAEQAFGATRGALAGVSVDDLRDALYASKIASYTQGFQMLARASEERGYGTDLGEVARIWTAGCIIRARFLDRVRAAFARTPAPELLALAPEFVADLGQRLPAWRRVVGASLAAGIPVPGLAASLAWYDTLVTARGSAAVIQAQRDYFGSHTYERSDAPGVAVHTDWPRFGG